MRCAESSVGLYRRHTIRDQDDVTVARRPKLQKSSAGATGICHIRHDWSMVQGTIRAYPSKVTIKTKIEWGFGGSLKYPEGPGRPERPKPPQSRVTSGDKIPGQQSPSRQSSSITGAGYGPPIGSFPTGTQSRAKLLFQSHVANLPTSPDALLRPPKNATTHFSVAHISESLYLTRSANNGISCGCLPRVGQAGTVQIASRDGCSGFVTIITQSPPTYYELSQ